LNNIKWLLD